MDKRNEDSWHTAADASALAKQDQDSEPYAANAIAHGGKFGSDQTVSNAALTTEVPEEDEH
jgi:hypothetical protein